MPDLRDYTVGWICAVEKELVAAIALLDEEHGEPDCVPVNDNNTYVLGRIGRHNVVIAALPAGIYGTISAATVARDLVRTVPNLRLGLMVGIGGGVPSKKNDIRLGDIVVSSPGKDYGGVIQYDFGRTVQNKEFEQTGSLNKPPELVLTAVASLKSTYRMKGHRIDQMIDDALQKYPRLDQEYRRPDTTTDTLYTADAIHIDGARSCATGCGDSIIVRDLRPPNMDDPQVHYGLIASGNQLMKDAKMRDKLGQERDVLCFEMEAAGLMDHFPCLVIRGICDYSDTHKNDHWQGYAAMTAAAYAKDLLSRIAPNKLEAERSIGELLSNVDDTLKQVTDHITETMVDVKHLKAGFHSKSIRDWLSPPDPSVNMTKASEARHPGTCEWFLRDPRYEAWKEGSKSFLWIHGKAGCGKTILSSMIIENLEAGPRTSSCILYFFFDFSDTHKQALHNAVRSLILQLYDQCEDVQGLLDSLLENGQTAVDIKTLCNIFQNMLEHVDRVWIVMDALDECLQRSKYQNIGLLPWIRSLVEAQGNVHILATSRSEQDIEASIRKWAHKDNIVALDSKLVGNDINRYIVDRVRNDERLSRWHSREDVLKEMERLLIQKSDGMFRWVSCQLDLLEQCLDYFQVRNALSDMPRTLDETYARILTSVPTEHRQHTQRILQLLAFSKRPMRIEEAVDAIAVVEAADGQLHFEPRNRMPVPEEILRYCSSLVIVVTTGAEADENDDNDSNGGLEGKRSNPEDQLSTGGEGSNRGSNIIGIKGSNQSDASNNAVKVITKKRSSRLQLAHFSVKEYLTSNRVVQEFAPYLSTVAANTAIARVCLAYLMSIDYSQKKILQSFPLAAYSAIYWPHHASLADPANRTITIKALELLSAEDAYAGCWMLRNRGYFYDQPPPSALYYASFTGLTRIVKILLDAGADVNFHEEGYSNALYAASYNGHVEVVAILLEAGADPNIQGGYHGSAIHVASAGGYIDVVKLLLGAGADVNVSNGWSDSPLLAAARKGHGEVTQLLINTGAQVDHRGQRDFTALYLAASKGYADVVQVLLEAGADVNLCGGWHESSIMAASARGYTAVTQLLFNAGADITAQSQDSDTILGSASYYGHADVVRLLLKEGADPNSRCAVSSTVLGAACMMGHTKVAQLFINAGADVNPRVKDSDTPLGLASYTGRADIVRMLLQAGADPNTPYTIGGTALGAACIAGRTKVARLLLTAGADINLRRSSTEPTAFELALKNVELDVARLLIENGATATEQMLETYASLVEAKKGSEKTNKTSTAIVDQQMPLQKSHQSVGGITETEHDDYAEDKENQSQP
ncbi:hypothetical protein BX600DRAFT_468158 [Xylariales sp. PMI_506]|nr:hypothetical protein BX600DRAFT_468158 [Xylariales sp. PMI_506]